MADLLFQAVAPASPHLVFGAESVDQAFIFAGPVARLQGTFSLITPADLASFTATLRPPSGTLECTYDDNIPSYTQGGAGAPWRSADGRGGTSAFPWGPGASLRRSGAIPWQSALGLLGGVGTSWRDGDLREPRATAVPWRDGDLREPPATSIPWRDGTRVLTSVAMPWHDGTRVLIQAGGGWRDGAKVLLHRGGGWRHGRLVLLPRSVPWRDGALLETHGNNPWPPYVPPEPPACYEVSPDLLFAAHGPASSNLVFACDYHVPGGPVASVIVPIRSVYTVINNVTLGIVGGASLPALTLSMQLDIDSWTWRWSATLPGPALSLVEPGLEVLATVNGTPFRLILEQIGTDRVFGKRDVRVSGRGRNALLDVVSATHGNAEARTANQMMDDALALYDPWAVDFGLTDWLVPAGVWSHQGTPISALQAVATAGGGYLQPHATAQTVRVLPRYAVAPWDWAGEVPDFELPAAVMRREGVEWVQKANYNRVYVSGTRDGVLAQVTRTGTAGDVLAPMVTDPLTTHADAGRQRGLAILGDTGAQQNVSLSLPVLPETGVIVPGKLVRYVDGATTRVGVVRSVSIDARFPTLTQTLGVETHE